MDLNHLRNQQTVENAFVVGLLLTANMKEAEDAVVESIDCLNADQASGDQMLLRVIHSSLNMRPEGAGPAGIDEASAAALPLDLRPVLYLPRELRECFVLRFLVGFSRDACAWLLQVEPEEIRSRMRKAAGRLARLRTAGAPGREVTSLPELARDAAVCLVAVPAA
jgi:hypothetical protein